MKLEEILKQREDWEAEQDLREQKHQVRIIAKLEALGFTCSDGWILGTRPGSDFVSVGHKGLAYIPRVRLTNGDLTATVSDELDNPVYVREARQLLAMMELGWQAPAVKTVPQETMTQRALNVAQELGAARQKWVAAVIKAAQVDRGARLAIALAEQRVIDEAGGEKELGSNVAAQARALSVAMQRDLGYGVAVEAQAAAQAEVAQAKAAMDGRQDELRVLTAAMRMVVDED